MVQMIQPGLMWLVLILEFLDIGLEVQHGKIPPSVLCKIIHLALVESQLAQETFVVEVHFGVELVVVKPSQPYAPQIV
jgi:hypothetical protein